MKSNKVTFIPSENPATKQRSNLTGQTMYFVAYAIYNRQKSLRARGPKGIQGQRLSRFLKHDTPTNIFTPPPPPPWTGTLVYERVKPRSMLPKASYTAESRVALIQPFESRLGRTWRSEIAEKRAVSSLPGVCLVHSPLTCSPLW